MHLKMSANFPTKFSRGRWVKGSVATEMANLLVWKSQQLSHFGRYWLGIFCNIRKWHSIPFHDSHLNWTINKYDLNIFLQCRDSHIAVKYLDIITHRQPLIGILKSYSLILIYRYVKECLLFSTSTSPFQKIMNLVMYNFAKIKIPIYLYRIPLPGFLIYLLNVMCSLVYRNWSAFSQK